MTATTAELNILDGVTATFTELNLIDGVTATTAELNILDGVTSTAAELNILDGVTSTAAELNILDGVTATFTELNLIDGVTATTAEINYVDVATAGTAEASKAMVLDGSKGITGITSLTSTTVAATTLTKGGDAVPAYYKGTYTTASVAFGATNTTAITHGLGTDDVQVILSAKGSSFNSFVHKVGYKRVDATYSPDAEGHGGATPSAGDVNIMVTNTSGSNAQTMVVNSIIIA